MLVNIIFKYFKFINLIELFKHFNIYFNFFTEI